MNYGNTEVFLSPQQREALIQSWLGKSVTVEIDRPIGYIHHVKGITLHYTVNYGYLPGVMGGDGEEQDVYVLGVDKPVARFTGRIIGVIRRKDDNEDKLVAAPDGMVFHQGQIAEAVHFVEQYFDSTVESLFHKSCGVIPYRIRTGQPEYLLGLQTASCGWSFPKGHMEAWETELETALRELREETGLTAQLHPDFRTELEYALSPVAWKRLVLFLGQVSGEPVRNAEEILDFRWVTAEQARQLLPKSTAAILEQTEAYLLEKDRSHS